MKYDPERHHRRSLRLPGHDYASSGAYFVTLVAYERACWFGEVVDAGVNCQVMRSEYGRIAREEWFCTAQRRPNVILHEDEFVVMPNHVHGIIWIMEDEVGAQRRCAPTMHDHNPSLYVAPGSLGAIVRAYKSAVARRINALRKPPERLCGSAIIMSTLSAVRRNWRSSRSTSRTTPPNGTKTGKTLPPLTEQDRGRASKAP